MTEVSHPEKLLFPADGITKGEVVGYYQAAADHMLGHLVARPLTLERYPAGIDKPGFMQKHAGKGFPPFIERIELPKQDGTVQYPSIKDAEGLTYLANQNTITFHIPCFRNFDLAHPDRLVFDLDPTEGDIDGARFGAQAVAVLLDQVGVPSQVMTSGSKGYHVVVHLAPTINFESLARFAQASAFLLAHFHSDRLTIEFLKKERKGRVFIDWLRNGFGATGVSPYSLRPRPGAPIAMPISWAELPETEPNRFRLRDSADRLATDPWAGSALVDLTDALDALNQLVAKRGIDLPEFDRFGR
ncbi:MAG TPA: non-homologous end-joining DNA ligase [Acidimicrobiia bacterium]|nr:non-homologous end-joining DNA ligase [Acidimicrobiia bacterium]